VAAGGRFFLLVLYIVQTGYHKPQYIVHVKKKTKKKALAPLGQVSSGEKCSSPVGLSM
jgi:hypothetical protein